MEGTGRISVNKSELGWGKAGCGTERGRLGCEDRRWRTGCLGGGGERDEISAYKWLPQMTFMRAGGS